MIPIEGFLVFSQIEVFQINSSLLGSCKTNKYFPWGNNHPKTRHKSRFNISWYSNITFVFNISFVIIVNEKLMKHQPSVLGTVKYFYYLNNYLQLLYREGKRILTLFRVPKISIRSHSECCGGKIGLGYPWLKKLYFPKS